MTRLFPLTYFVDMTGIKPRYREVYKLRKDGLTFEEIGDRLGITRQRAWQIFVRAEKKIRKERRTSRLQVAAA